MMTDETKPVQACAQSPAEAHGDEQALRAAALQAIAALERTAHVTDADRFAAADSLRAALTANVQPKGTEPVYRRRTDAEALDCANRLNRSFPPSNLKDEAADHIRELVAVVQAPAPAHAPGHVAWVVRKPGGYCEVGYEARVLNKLEHGTPLYTAPKSGSFMTREQAIAHCRNRRPGIQPTEQHIAATMDAYSALFGDLVPATETASPAVEADSEIPDHAVEINRLRNVIQAACSGGLDHMIERWKVLFPDAPVPTVRVQTDAQDGARYQWLREHTVATGLSAWVGDHMFLDVAVDDGMKSGAAMAQSKPPVQGSGE